MKQESSQAKARSFILNEFSSSHKVWLPLWKAALYVVGVNDIRPLLCWCLSFWWSMVATFFTQDRFGINPYCWVLTIITWIIYNYNMIKRILAYSWSSALSSCVCMGKKWSKVDHFVPGGHQTGVLLSYTFTWPEFCSMNYRSGSLDRTRAGLFLHDAAALWCFELALQNSEYVAFVALVHKAVIINGSSTLLK